MRAPVFSAKTVTVMLNYLKILPVMITAMTDAAAKLMEDLMVFDDEECSPRSDLEGLLTNGSIFSLL